MKKNGFTLIELLASLVISSIAMTIVFSIFVTGIKQNENTKKDVSIQQEANYVATKLRKEYLSKNEYNESVNYTISVSNNQIVLNGIVISDKFQYQSKITYENKEYLNEEVAIYNKKPVMIQITFFSGNKSYTLRTMLSRGV